MRLEELAELLNRHIVVERMLQSVLVAGIKKPWHCQMKDTETKEHGSCVIGSDFGIGATPNEAIQDYVGNLRGKLVVLNSTDREKRREFSVPLSLEA